LDMNMGTGMEEGTWRLFPGILEESKPKKEEENCETSIPKIAIIFK
jgi:hypothetical protein